MRVLRVVIYGLVFILTVLCVIFLLLANMQGQDAGTTPAAPAPQSDVCYHGTRDAEGQTIYEEVPCRLPDAPSATILGTNQKDWHEIDETPRRAGFWTVGRWDAARPLRTNHELVRSKRFWLLELALYGSTFAEVEIARNHRQEPNIPTHGDLYVDAYVPLPFVTLMHVLANKYICECVGDGAVAAASVWALMAVKGQYYH